MTDLSLYRYSHSMEVRFADIDGMGHVNNAKFFTYMEATRIRYMWDVVGWDGDIKSLDFILAHISCDFKLPLVYGDTVCVHIRVTRFGRTSFNMDYALVREGDGAIVAVGESVQVAFDYGSGSPVPIPDTWRARISAFEPAIDS